MATWMDLESIMLSEISQTGKDKCCMISCICGIEKNRFTETNARLVLARGWGVREMGEGGHRAGIPVIRWLCSGDVVAAWR